MEKSCHKQKKIRYRVLGIKPLAFVKGKLEFGNQTVERITSVVVMALAVVDLSPWKWA